MTVPWQGCRLLWRRPTGRWWRSWGSWPWWAWLGWRRSRSGSLSSATNFFPTGSRAWCYKQGQWHCFCNRLHNWCQQNIMVLILVMITGIRCSGDQRRVSVWLVGDQVLFLFEDTTTGLNWSGRAKDGTTHDDPYYKFVYCLPPPCGMKYVVQSQKTQDCARRCVSCGAFCEKKASLLKKTVSHQIYRASK